MAAPQFSRALPHGDHPTRTPNFHLAAMRRAEDAARSISVRRSVGSIPADKLVEATGTQHSYFLLAAAHRAAARRLDRPNRVRASVVAVFWPVTRLVRSVRRAVTA